MAMRDPRGEAYRSALKIDKLRCRFMIVIIGVPAGDAARREQSRPGGSALAEWFDR
jgi:hypothetical protein